MPAYFSEIKNRLVLLNIVWISTVFASYAAKQTLFFIIIDRNILRSSKNFYFIFTDVTEIFSVYWKLILVLSFQISLFYLMLHVFLFLAPAFLKVEYLIIKYSFKIIFFWWIFSALFAIRLLIPISWNFFLNYQNLVVRQPFNLYFEAKINEFLNFYLTFFYLSEFHFQFFAMLFLIFNFLNVHFKTIKKFRKVFYYGFIILATLISPPEFLNQILTMFLIIWSYEILIINFLIAQRIKTNKNKNS